jgi:hypothetical protein
MLWLYFIKEQSMPIQRFQRVDGTSGNDTLNIKLRDAEDAFGIYGRDGNDTLNLTGVTPSQQDGKITLRTNNDGDTYMFHGNYRMSYFDEIENLNINGKKVEIPAEGKEIKI